MFGLINGQRTRLSLDIGAMDSIMSARLVKRLGLELMATNDQVKTVTNQVSPVVGQTSILTRGTRRAHVPFAFVGS